VRYHEAGRYILERDHVILDSSFGPISVKRVRYPHGEVRLVPEFDVCRRIALERGLPLRTVYDTVARDAAERKITGKQGDVA